MINSSESLSYRALDVGHDCSVEAIDKIRDINASTDKKPFKSRQLVVVCVHYSLNSHHITVVVKQPFFLSGLISDI